MHSEGTASAKGLRLFARIARAVLGLGCCAFPCLLPAVSLANPSGEAVRFGDVQFHRNGGNLRIVQGGSHAIIDWDRFSIAHGETTRFFQPGPNAAALNRVHGQVISRIDGTLRANGQVFLLNPNGIVVGRDGIIDVAGFTGSTLDVEDSEFLAGGDLRFRGSSQAGIVNLGQISASQGDVFLLAATVDNSGYLRAPRGTVGLAAGNDILLKESGEERVYVRGASGGKKESGVVNRGQIEANVAELKAHGGNLYGMAVKNEGRVAATGVSREGGQIFLRAGGQRPVARSNSSRGRSGGGKIQSTGTLRARPVGSGAGGQVTVDAGPEGEVEIGGRVDASAAGRGSDALGGSVVLLGKDIRIFEDTLILADGSSGGGRIFVGGGHRGEDRDFFNATDVTVEEGALLRADAEQRGDGGEIVVFAESGLRFSGEAAARGGRRGGDGGWVELSGKKTVDIPRGLVDSVNVRARHRRGSNGTALIDPNDIHIRKGAAGTAPIGFSPATNDTLYDGDISAFLAEASLVIETNFDEQSGSGDIFVHAGVNISWNSDSDLTIKAARHFEMSGGSAIRARGGGDITIEALGSARFLGSAASPAVITTALGGNVTVEAAGYYSPPEAISMVGAAFRTEGGDISLLSGNGSELSGAGDGFLAEDSTIQSASGDIALMGLGGPDGDSRGVVLIGTPVLTGGSITVSGQGMGDGEDIFLEKLPGVGGLRAPEVTLEGLGDGRVVSAGTLNITNFRFSNIVQVEGQGGGEGNPAKLIVSDGPSRFRIGAFTAAVGPLSGQTFAAALTKGTAFLHFNEISGGAGNDHIAVDLPAGLDYGGTLSGGAGRDRIVIGPGGGGIEGLLRGGTGVDTISYAQFTEAITARPDSGSLPFVSSFQGFERFVGSQADDRLVGSSGGDVIRITRDDAGILNGLRFVSFEHIEGRGGDDRFVFRNQATVRDVRGGGGFDTLLIDDRDLGGENTYFVRQNRIVRNPTYRFNGIGAVEIQHGGGDDTVVTGRRDFEQEFDGGEGVDTLRVPDGTPVDRNPITIEDSRIGHINFERPRSSVGGRSDFGDQLTHQVGNDDDEEEWWKGGEEENQFNAAPSDGQGMELFQGNLIGATGGPFATAAVSALVGQAGVIVIDGVENLFDAPASLDGQFVHPPEDIIDRLRELLDMEVWAEMADAIELAGPAILIGSDGAWAIDLSGPAPAAIANRLGEELDAAAAAELLAAIEVAVVIPVTAENGALAIVAVPVPPDPAIVARLNGLLDDGALSELAAALDG